MKWCYEDGEPIRNKSWMISSRLTKYLNCFKPNATKIIQVNGWQITQACLFFNKSGSKSRKYLLFKIIYKFFFFFLFQLWWVISTTYKLIFNLYLYTILLLSAKSTSNLYVISTWHYHIILILYSKKIFLSQYFCLSKNLFTKKYEQIELSEQFSVS